MEAIPRKKINLSYVGAIDVKKCVKETRMKRETLESLGLSSEQIDTIMKENGNDINRERAKFADYDEIKKQLETANATLDKMKDYENVKADVLKYQQEAENAKAEALAKVEQMELQQRIKDYTNGKKFVNSLTRDAIDKQLESALNDVANKGKSLDELFNVLTDGKTDILIDETKPTPPTVTPMSGKQGITDDLAQARAVMGLPPNK